MNQLLSRSTLRNALTDVAMREMKLTEGRAGEFAAKALRTRGKETARLARLHGDKVSGLHTEQNLTLLQENENIRKGARFSVG